MNLTTTIFSAANTVVQTTTIQPQPGLQFSPNVNATLLWIGALALLAMLLWTNPVIRRAINKKINGLQLNEDDKLEKIVENEGVPCEVTLKDEPTGRVYDIKRVIPGNEDNYGWTATFVSDAGDEIQATDSQVRIIPHWSLVAGNHIQYLYNKSGFADSDARQIKSLKKQLASAKITEGSLTNENKRLHDNVGDINARKKQQEGKLNREGTALSTRHFDKDKDKDDDDDDQDADDDWGTS